MTFVQGLKETRTIPITIAPELEIKLRARAEAAGVTVESTSNGSLATARPRRRNSKRSPWKDSSTGNRLRPMSGIGQRSVSGSSIGIIRTAFGELQSPKPTGILTSTPITLRGGELGCRAPFLLIFYQTYPDGVDILRVVHGSRNPRALLRREGIE